MSDERIEFRYGGNGYIIQNGGKVYKKGPDGSENYIHITASDEDEAKEKIDAKYNN